MLLKKRDHPTAEEVFIRARHGLPEISMVAVYNCLDVLVAGFKTRAKCNSDYPAIFRKPRQLQVPAGDTEPTRR